MNKLSFRLLSWALMLVGLASCGGASSDDVEYLPVQTTEDGAWHFINSKGEIVGNQEWEFEPTVTISGIFSVLTNDGYSVYKWDSKEAKPIDSLQNLVSVGVINEGLLPVTPSMQRIRVVNSKGDVKFVLEPKDGQEISSCAGIVQDGMLVVSNMEGKSGAVNSNGEWIVAPKYDDMSNFNNGYALAIDYNFDDGNEDSGPSYYVIDKQGNEIKVEGKFGYPEGECESVPEFMNGVVSVIGPMDPETYEYSSFEINTKGEVRKLNDTSTWTQYLDNGGSIVSNYTEDTSTYTWKDKDGNIVMETKESGTSLTAYGKYVTLSKENSLIIYDDKGKELSKLTGDYWASWPGGKFGLKLQKYNRDTYSYEDFILLSPDGKQLETPKLYGIGTDKSVNALNYVEGEWEGCGEYTVTSAYVDVTAAASKLVSMINGNVTGKETYYIGESVKDILEGESVQFLRGKNFSIPTPVGKYYIATGAGFNISGQINASADIVSPTYKQYFEVHHYDNWGRAWGWNRKKQVGVQVNPSAKVVSFDIVLRTNHPSGSILKEAIARRMKKDGFTMVSSGDNYEEYTNNYREAIIYASKESKGVGVLIGEPNTLKLSESAKASLAAQI